jgi:hypothetical protein
MLELTDYRLYENVAKLMAEVDVLREYIRLIEAKSDTLEERIKKLEEKE